MKHPQCKVLLCFIVGLLFMGITAYLVPQMFDVAPYAAELHWFAQLIPALLFMLSAVAAHLLSRRRASWAYILGYLMNAIGSGWAIGVLMGVKDIQPAPELFSSLLPAAIMGIVYCALIGKKENNWQKSVSIAFFVLCAMLLVSGIVIWICRVPVVGCTFLFSALFLLPFPIAVGVALDTPDEANEIYRHLSFSGFGAFFLILFVVVLILSEGEILEGADLDLGSGGKKRKK